jgi:outer membrane protein assembly factor BamB
MNDGGANEPTPIVHDGIIYLTNTTIHLALDGRTGELIWENRIGPDPPAVTAPRAPWQFTMTSCC